MPVSIRVGWLRSEPLTPAELGGIHEMSARCAGIRWPGLSSISIQPLDGDGDWRAALLTQREAPDPGLRVMPLLADRIMELWRLIPNSQIQIDDPTRLLGVHEDNIVLGHSEQPATTVIPKDWPQDSAILVLPSNTAPLATDPNRSFSNMEHSDRIEKIESLGTRFLQAVDQLERSQQTDPTPSLSGDLLLSDIPDSIPSNLLEQAVQSIYFDQGSSVFPAEWSIEHQTHFVLSLLESNSRTATGAALWLAQGNWPAQAIPGLLDALNGLAHAERQPWPLRALCVQAIPFTSRPDAPEFLRNLASSTTVQVARAAIRSLGLLDDGPSRALLRSAARIPALSAHAIAAMAQFGDPYGCTIAAELSSDPRDEVRLSIAHHLPQLGGRRAIPILEKLKTDPYELVRLEATISLAQVCTTEQLLDMMESQDSQQVICAIQGIARADRAGKSELLLRASADPRVTVKEAAIEALGAIGLPFATPALLQCLDDPESDIVLAAIESLAQCGDRRSRRKLQSIAAKPGPHGTAAKRAVTNGVRMERPAPDAQVTIRAWRDTPLSQIERHRIQRLMEPTAMQLKMGPCGFFAQGETLPRNLGKLHELVEVIQQLDLGIGDLKWCVSDGQQAIRRGSTGWFVSGTRGAPVDETEAQSAPPPVTLLPDEPQKARTPAASAPIIPESEPLFDQETLVRPAPIQEAVDAPTLVVQSDSSVGAVRDTPIAIASDEDVGFEEDLPTFTPDAANTSSPDGLVVAIGATTSASDDIGSIIEVHQPIDQANDDPGFSQERANDDGPSTAFVYIEPPSTSNEQPFQVQSSQRGHIKAYSNQAPLDDEVDVYESTADDFSGPPKMDDEIGSWAPLLSAEDADDFLMDMVWGGINHQDRERLSKWLVSNNPLQVQAACRVIATVGEAVDMAALQDAIRHADPNTRAAAAHALGTVGGPDVLQMLQHCTQDENPKVQTAALDALILLRKNSDRNAES